MVTKCLALGSVLTLATAALAAPVTPGSAPSANRGTTLPQFSLCLAAEEDRPVNLATVVGLLGAGTGGSPAAGDLMQMDGAQIPLPGGSTLLPASPGGGVGESTGLGSGGFPTHTQLPPNDGTMQDRGVVVPLPGPGLMGAAGLFALAATSRRRRV